jgi:PIN domain nuclease of toxin-antitoxin system
LVDSHVALWWLDENPSLGPRSRSVMQTSDELFFSVVTVWELGIKRALGKLTMPDGLVDELIAAGLSPLLIGSAHAELAPALPLHHRDPFDRMLIAQAKLESLVLVTADQSMTLYDVELLDARS